ncbi:MAG: DNA-binding protein [Desulfobacterales bacterium]|nr:DNA-binding protein [Desulfobacterales bacterium]
MLNKAGLPVRASYRRSEVCAVLGCSTRLFWSLLDRYEKDPETGSPLRPDSLGSYMFGRERRVTFDELEDYLRRNDTFHRKYALNPR